MTSTATFQRQQREDRYRNQMKRIAWTYTDPHRQPHAARNWRPLTDQQKAENDIAFERAVAAWPNNRNVDPQLPIAGVDPQLAIAGDEAMIYSRGAVRAGVITKVGRSNFEVMYVTPSAIAQSVRYGWGIPVTRVSVRKDAPHAVRKGG
jgi:hypothetical protein